MSKIVVPCFIAVFMICLLPVYAAAAQEDAVDPNIQAYWDLVSDSDRLFSTGTPSDAAISSLTERWQAVVEQFETDKNLVQLQVHPNYILQQLERSPRDDQRLGQLFSALKVIEEIEAARIPSSFSGDPLAALDAIAAENDLRSVADEDDAESENRLERFFNRVEELLYGSRLAIGPITVNLFGLIGIVLFGFVITFILQSLLSDFVTNASLLDLEDEEGIPLTAESALKQAGTTAEAGDYRSAVRYLYLSTLLSLEEQSLLRYDRSLTNREYLRQLDGKPQLAALLKDVVEVFDQVWYGFAPIDDKTFQTYADRIAHLQKNKGGL